MKETVTFEGLVSGVSGKLGQQIFDQHLNPNRVSAKEQNRQIEKKAPTEWQKVFKTFDLLWQGFSQELKDRWNVIGKRRKTIGYNIFMSYNLKNRKPPLAAVIDPSQLPEGAPPI